MPYRKSKRRSTKRKSTRHRKYYGSKKAIGSRAQVMHGNADHTVGGLQKRDLKYNKSGKIVSRIKSRLGKEQYRLYKDDMKYGQSLLFGSPIKKRRSRRRRSSKKRVRRCLKKKRSGGCKQYSRSHCKTFRRNGTCKRYASGKRRSTRRRKYY